jgi:hypothetical protein
VWQGVSITGGIDDNELEIHGQRLAGATGMEVGANDFRISDMGPDGSSEFDASTPAVAYSGTNNEYFVLWSGNDTIGDAPSDGGGEDFEIYGQRIDGATGMEIGINDVRLSDMGPEGDRFFNASAPAIAYNGIDNEYLVTWHGDDNTGKLVEDEYEIFGQRWSNCGDAVVDTGEECDPGENDIGGGSCTPMCTLDPCGNGIVDANEECDLGTGNGLPGASCSLTCQSSYEINLDHLHDLLVTCEVCAPEARAPLIDLLSRAQAQLDKGNLRPALTAMQQFVKKTDQFLRKGQLPDAEGRRLQLQAELVVAQLEEQLAGPATSAGGK